MRLSIQSSVPTVLDVSKLRCFCSFNTCRKVVSGVSTFDFSRFNLNFLFQSNKLLSLVHQAMFVKIWLFEASNKRVDKTSDFSVLFFVRSVSTVVIVSNFFHYRSFNGFLRKLQILFKEQYSWQVIFEFFFSWKISVLTWELQYSSRVLLFPRFFQSTFTLCLFLHHPNTVKKGKCLIGCCPFFLESHT